MVALIPARGGSKSIPLKNIKELNGRPLIYWTIDAAISCGYIEKVYVSTDSELIREKVHEYVKLNGGGSNCDKLECIGRAPETATDTASTESVMLEFAKEHNFGQIILIQPTSPLLTEKDLTGAIKKYTENKYDSLLSVVRQKRFIWKESGQEVEPVNYNPLHRPRRQEFNGFLVENGAFYITSREHLLGTGCRISGRTGHYEMQEDSYFEIDEPSDWRIVEAMLKNNAPQDSISKKAARIKLLLTDCDGVLTDGGMYYSESGEEMKKFNTRDGMGIQLLREHGIKVGIITGEDRELVRRRALKLRTEELHMGARNKLEVLEEIIKKHKLAYDEVAYIGDDINDIEAIKSSGLGCCVSDAVDSVKEISDYITKAAGGQGAVREVAELILSSKRMYKQSGI